MERALAVWRGLFVVRSVVSEAEGLRSPAKVRPQGGGEVLRHGGREVVVIVIDHAAINDRCALGAWAEGCGEVEDR